MTLKAPKFGTWLTAFILGLLGTLIRIGIVDMSISFVELDLGFWLMFAAFAMLILAAYIRGM